MIKFSWRMQSVAGWGTVTFTLLALVSAFVLVPVDDVQGAYVNIMYIHVPASWGALSIYTFMALFSVYGIVSRVPQAFLVSKAIAPIGFAYCVISLVTGSLWGKPTWGAFWVWDARLTSMFVLLIFYIIYLHLSQTYHLKRLVPASFLAVIGWVNIPIIKYSVEWWYTLHQPSSVRIFERSSSIDWQIMVVLLCMVVALVSYTLYLASYRVRYLIHHIADK